MTEIYLKNLIFLLFKKCKKQTLNYKQEIERKRRNMLRSSNDSENYEKISTFLLNQRWLYLSTYICLGM